MSKEYLLFIKTNLRTRYWDRSEQLWTEHPVLAVGYWLVSSARAQVTRLERQGAFKLPAGETLKTWGFIRKDEIQ